MTVYKRVVSLKKDRGQWQAMLPLEGFEHANIDIPRVTSDVIFHDLMEHMESTTSFELPRMGSNESEILAAGVATYCSGQWVSPYNFTAKPNFPFAVGQLTQINRNYLNSMRSFLPAHMMQQLLDAFNITGDENSQTFNTYLLGIQLGSVKYKLPFGKMADFYKLFRSKFDDLISAIEKENLSLRDIEPFFVGVLADPKSNTVKLTFDIDDSYFTTPTVESARGMSS